MLFDLESNEIEISNEVDKELNDPLYKFTIDSKGDIIKINDKEIPIFGN